MKKQKEEWDEQIKEFVDKSIIELMSVFCEHSDYTFTDRLKIHFETNEDYIAHKINQEMSDYKTISGLADTVAKLRIEKRRFEEWADNVRKFFGDEAMMEFYEIYGDEEE